MATNSILQFTPTDTGTNLLSDAAYLAASDRTNGNQPGVASAKLNNKALRQATLMAAGLAQYIADRQATNIADTLTPAQIATALGTATQGRLIRTLRYSKIAGVQYVSINGASDTTTGASTYTPDANMAYADCEAVGGGGGAGGSVNPTAGQISFGAPGAAGSYGRSIFLAATIGASQAITIGAGGAGGNGANGTTGSTTSIGSLLTAPGGGGGTGGPTVAVPSLLGQYAATSAATGANLLAIVGAPGGPSISMAAAVSASYGGQGGGTLYGAPTPFTGANANGISAANYGCGGSGTAILNGAGPATGGAGAAGVIFIREYAK